MNLQIRHRNLAFLRGALGCHGAERRYICAAWERRHRGVGQNAQYVTAAARDNGRRFAFAPNPVAAQATVRLLTASRIALCSVTLPHHVFQVRCEWQEQWPGACVGARAAARCWPDQEDHRRTDGALAHLVDELVLALAALTTQPLLLMLLRVPGVPGGARRPRRG